MVAYILIGLIYIWLVIISWTVHSTRKHYFNLVGKIRKKNLDEILDIMLENDEKLKKGEEDIKKNLLNLENQAQLHIQKIGLVRYDPFERMGGEQSYVLALIDKCETGIIMNFIYTHDGIRVYTKRVKNGKSEGHELSHEEMKAIKESK